MVGGKGLPEPSPEAPAGHRDSRPRRPPHPAHLALPRDGHGAGGELGVEVVVRVVQVDALHGGELLDVQHVLTVHGAGLRGRVLGQRGPGLSPQVPARPGVLVGEAEGLPEAAPPPPNLCWPVSDLPAGPRPGWGSGA